MEACKKRIGALCAVFVMLVVGCAQENIPQPLFDGPVTGATVTLDVFSGRPNPQWNLTAAEARELMRLLEALPRSEKTSEEFPGNLGYRGFFVSFPVEQSLPGWVRVSGSEHEVGISDIGPSYVLLDEDQTIERWLLESGEEELGLALSTQIADKIEEAS